MVAPAENFADLREGDLRLFAQEVHCDLTGQCHFLGAVTPEQFFGGETEFAGDQVYHIGGFDLAARGDQVSECNFHKIGRERGSAQVRVGDDAVQRTFQLSDIGLYTFCNAFKDLIGDLPAGSLGFGA